MYYKMAKKNEKIQKEKIIKQKIEKVKEKKEKQKEEERSKVLVIENIRNFYKDRIDELREKIRQEREQNDIVRYEQKQLLSGLGKEERMEKSKK